MGKISKLALILAVIGAALWGGYAAKSWWHAVGFREGDSVSFEAGTIGCRTIDPTGEWHDCRRLMSGGGLISDHPTLPP